jgi:hypothetical protein
VSTAQYNPTKVVGSWATPTPLGVIDLLDGIVDGEFFALTKDTARWIPEHDGNGNYTRVRNNARGGSFSITYSASSPTNHKLSLAVEADDVSENVVGPMILKDLNGTSTVELDDVYIEDVPDLSFGAERGSRVWTFHYSVGRIHVGGHDVL